MRSVRLDDEQERRLTAAARMTGEPVSEIIREAVREKCDEILGDSIASRLGDVIGSVNGRGKYSARNSSRDFRALLETRHAASRAARAKPRRGRRK